MNDRIEIFNNPTQGDFEWALRTFINRFKKSGLLAELRLREAFESPSQKRRRKVGESARRRKRLAMRRTQNEAKRSNPKETI
jgi:small subunit ribosomal protein S21